MANVKPFQKNVMATTKTLVCRSTHSMLNLKCDSRFGNLSIGTFPNGARRAVQVPHDFSEDEIFKDMTNKLY